MAKAVLLTLLTFLSSVATAMVAVWVESGAHTFGDVSPVAYGVVFLGAFGGSITTLIAKLQQQTRGK